MVALSAVGIDTLFYACVCNIVGHLQILQHRFSSVQLHDKTNRSLRPTLSREFRKMIVYHNKIISLADSLSDVYQPIMLMQFLITSLLLCVIAYQLTLVSIAYENRIVNIICHLIFQSNQGPVSFVIYVTFLLAICFQCFVYCHGGSTLEMESESLATIIYTCHWQESHCSVQRCMLLCLMRAQKPMQIRATFFSANLPLFSSVRVLFGLSNI